MPRDELTLETLYLACRKLEKYYGGAAELTAILAWHPGVGLEAVIPHVSPEVATDCELIVPDPPLGPMCRRFPICDDTVPAELVARIAGMVDKLDSVSTALQALVPYFRPDPPPFPDRLR